MVFGRETWYRAVRGDEEIFAGVLEKLPRGGRNSYVLVMNDNGQAFSREVFTGDDPRILLPFVNSKVKVIGTAMTLKVEGRRVHEIWPAKVEAWDGRDIPIGPRR